MEDMQATPDTDMVLTHMPVIPLAYLIPLLPQQQLKKKPNNFQPPTHPSIVQNTKKNNMLYNSYLAWNVKS